MKFLYTLLSMFILFLAIMLVFAGCNAALGIRGFGPQKTVTATVNRLYVDHSAEDSHYMVGTDQGVFEVSNGIILGIWNADEIYSSLEEGRKYNITIKGNQIANILLQEYPRVLSVKPVE